MLAAFVNKEEGGLSIEEVEVPNLSEGEVLVRLRASGICGTDIEKIKGRNITAPLLGHEVSGVIEESRSPKYREGERIVAHHHVACYSCERCFQGKFTMCDLFKKSNFDPCGFAEIFRVPSGNVDRGGILPLPEEISYEEGSIVEPLACCYRALKNAQITPGITSVIVGVGSIGLLHLTLLPLFGARKIFVTDLVKERIDLALKLGADGGSEPRTDAKALLQDLGMNEGADLVISASGSPGAISNSLNLLKTGGKLLLFGAPERGSKIEVPFDDLFLSEKEIVPSYSASEADMRQSLELVASKKAEVRKIISETFPLRQTKQAFSRAQSTPGKIIVTN